MKRLILIALLSASPALAGAQSPQTARLTPQDMSDIQTALATVGSHCAGNNVPACQAGADSAVIFAKIKAVYDAQQAEKPKK